MFSSGSKRFRTGAPTGSWAGTDHPSRLVRSTSRAGCPTASLTLGMIMNKSLITVMLLQLMCGCVQVPNQSTPRLFAVSFRAGLLDQSKGESVHRLVITACPASVYRIDKLPYDWSAVSSSPSSFEVTCTLQAGHDSSATWDIHDLNNVVYLRISPEDEKDLILTAEVYVTEGRSGPGRTISADKGQINLKPVGSAPDWQ